MNRGQLSTILASVDARDVRQPDASYPVWTISEPGLLSVAGRARRYAISSAKLKILREFSVIGLSSWRPTPSQLSGLIHFAVHRTRCYAGCNPSR